jgi:sulfonate transport system permease protein
VTVDDQTTGASGMSGVAGMSGATEGSIEAAAVAGDGYGSSSATGHGESGAGILRRTPGPAERNPRGHARRRRTIELGLGIGVPVVLVVLWQIASSAEWIDPRLYPSPTDLAERTPDLFRDQNGGRMGTDVGRSVQRMLWGYFWGALFGVAVGVLMGMSRLFRAALDPLLSALYTVPKLALIGVFLLILGYDDTPVITVIALTVFFFVWIQTMASIMAVAPGYREAAASFGARRWQLFRHVLLPAALPQIFVGLRVAAGVTVLTVIGVEFVFAPGTQGLGYRINNARQLVDPGQMYVAIVIAALLGVVFSWIVRFVGRRLAPWAPEDQGAPQA